MVSRSVPFGAYLKAGYPCLWVETREEERAIRDLSLEAEGYHVFCWDLVSGLSDSATGQVRPMADPVKALQAVPALPEGGLIFLRDFHRFINSIEIIRTIKNLVPTLKGTDRHIIVVSPLLQIPVELEKDFTALIFALPTVDDLLHTASRIVEENGLAITIDEQAVAAGRGLTLHEAENAMALSLVTEKTFSKSVIEAEKLQAVRKSGLMDIYEAVPETELGGLNSLKRYIHRRKRGFGDPTFPGLKGVLLTGVPGAGKSLSAKVIASVFDIPLVRLDIASLKGSLVGESEQKMRQALALIDAISPCVVWIDEIEKALGGVISSARSDAGTTANMFGSLLTWMEESRTRKYIVATCNDIDDLLTISQGALLRRFDDIFFLDLPSTEERVAILAIMNARYGTTLESAMVERMDCWTGAEIEKFVVAGIYDGPDEAFGRIKPIFHQNREKIERAREWASLNARQASEEAEPLAAVRRVRV